MTAEEDGRPLSKAYSYGCGCGTACNSMGELQVELQARVYGVVYELGKLQLCCVHVRARHSMDFGEDAIVLKSSRWSVEVTSNQANLGQCELRPATRFHAWDQFDLSTWMEFRSVLWHLHEAVRRAFPTVTHHNVTTHLPDVYSGAVQSIETRVRSIPRHIESCEFAGELFSDTAYPLEPFKGTRPHVVSEHVRLAVAQQIRGCLDFFEESSRSREADLRSEVERCYFCQHERNEDAVFSHRSWRTELAHDQVPFGKCATILKRHAGSIPDTTEEEWEELLSALQLLHASLRRLHTYVHIDVICCMNAAYLDASAGPNPHVHVWMIPRHRDPATISGEHFEDVNFPSYYYLGAHRRSVTTAVRDEIVRMLREAAGQQDGF